MKHTANPENQDAKAGSNCQSSKPAEYETELDNVFIEAPSSTVDTQPIRHMHHPRQNRTTTQMFDNFHLEVKLRVFFYVFYFVIFPFMTFKCFTFYEGCFTPVVFIALISWRIIVSKWGVQIEEEQQTEIGMVPSDNECKRCRPSSSSMICCFIMTSVALIFFIFVNVVNKRFHIHNEEEETLCAYTVPEVIIDHFNPNITESQLNTTVESPFPGRCIFPCYLIHFYPIGLLIFDLIGYIGLFNIIACGIFRIYYPIWSKAIHFCTHPLLSPYFTKSIVFLWVTFSLVQIGICICVIVLLKFNTVPLCIALLVSVLLWFASFVLPFILRKKKWTFEDALISPVESIRMGVTLAGVFFFITIIAICVNELNVNDPLRDKATTYIPVDSVFTHSNKLRFGVDAQFWFLLMWLWLLQVGGLALGYSNLVKEAEMDWTLTVSFFIYPIIPLLVIMCLSFAIYVIFFMSESDSIKFENYVDHVDSLDARFHRKPEHSSWSSFKRDRVHVWHLRKSMHNKPVPRSGIRGQDLS